MEQLTLIDTRPWRPSRPRLARTARVEDSDELAVIEGAVFGIPLGVLLWTLVVLALFGS